MANLSIGTAKAKEGATAVAIDHQNPEAVRRLSRLIERRAYEFYEERGQQDGGDMNDWLRAESEVAGRSPDLREASSWYTVNVPISGCTPQEVYVGVDAKRGVVVAEKEEKDGKTLPADMSSRESICMVTKWPADVDPATATAYVKDDQLTVTVKRSDTGREESSNAEAQKVSSMQANKKA